MTTSPRVLDVHTPFASFALSHSITQESLGLLYDKLTRKVHNSYHGQRVGPGWLKYEFNDSIWDLDDDSDYIIFVWRQQQHHHPQTDHQAFVGSSSFSSAASVTSTSTSTTAPVAVIVPPHSAVLYLHDPTQPLPSPPDYQNTSYYVFHPSHQSKIRALASSARSTKSRGTIGRKTKKSNGASMRDGGGGQTSDFDNNDEEKEGASTTFEPNFKQAFNKFHSENGVRTVMGSIGPVKDVRMLLKAGYRHVYISRKFALDHGFIPADAAPGHYGYSGLVNIGTWPITLTPSTVQNNASLDNPPSSLLLPSSQNTASRSHFGSTVGHGHRHGSNASSISNTSKSKSKSKFKLAKDPTNASTIAGPAVSGPKPTMMTVYLSEEPHFDVVLGRSFFERRQIRLTSVDPTDVVCMDTGEKIECELVILKDGRGEIVTVT
ncbi:hypothetical protein D9757_003661 [Collybiopsis confluens]|uniref:Uncharacterized protein n=1 Tax=Collybiopsis confluens TaxID=2823264 RepID=A0A8H5HUS0_9AGAR|nr:hypothetical protein D9757_003661 [Collybiopsis confluens]